MPQREIRVRPDLRDSLVHVRHRCHLNADGLVLVDCHHVKESEQIHTDFGEVVEFFGVGDEKT